MKTLKPSRTKKQPATVFIGLAFLIAALLAKRAHPNFGHKWAPALILFFLALVFILVLLFLGRKKNNKSGD